jgi:potassium channel subfamily K
MDRKRNHAEETFLQRGLTMRDLSTLDLDSDGKVTKAEFLTYMLVALQKVSQEDMDELLVVFDRLDVDKSGTLTPEDLVGATAAVG